MRHGRVAFLAVVCAAVLATAPAAATTRYYPNLAETSPDGRLRLEAKSPENTPQRDGPFAANFVYTLSDVTTSKLVWSRAQPKSDRCGRQERREGSPVAAFVHGSGTVVVWTCMDDLMVLDPRGTVTLELPILESIPEAERERYVSWSTAGPMWAGNSHWYYFTANGKLHFGIRTWWDRRIIVSIPDAKQVADEGPVRNAAAACEREYALSTLRKASEVARKWSAKQLPEYSHQDESPWKEVRGPGTAVTLAHRMVIKEALPLLQDVERVPNFGGSTISSEEVPEGQLFIHSYSFDSRRSAVQLAIRRLGGTPLALPTKEMVVAKADNKWGDRYRPRTHSTPRSARVGSVTTAMGARQVADSIGEPDYVFSGGGIGEDVWEYDIDAEKPFTLRVAWKDNKMVRSERVEPPVWKDGNKRDMQHY